MPMKRNRSSLRWVLAWEQVIDAGHTRLWYRLADGRLHPIELRRMFVTPESIPLIGDRLASRLESERVA